MTNLQALECEVAPYCTGANQQLELEKAMLSACHRAGAALSPSEEYNPEFDRVIALAAVLVLCKYLSLSSEEESEWKQGYNDKLKERIKMLCKAAGIDASEFVPDAVIKLSHASNRF